MDFFIIFRADVRLRQLKTIDGYPGNGLVGFQGVGTRTRKPKPGRSKKLQLQEQDPGHSQGCQGANNPPCHQWLSTILLARTVLGRVQTIAELCVVSGSHTGRAILVDGHATGVRGGARGTSRRVRRHDAGVAAGGIDLRGRIHRDVGDIDCNPIAVSRTGVLAVVATRSTSWGEVSSMVKNSKPE